MAVALAEPRPLEPDPMVLGVSEDERIEGLEKSIEELRSTLGEIEARFESYNAALAIYEARVSRLEHFQAAAAMIGSWKASTCIYQENGVCRLWRISGEAAKQLSEVTVSKDGATRIDVRKAPWFCALCPLYKQRRS